MSQVQHPVLSDELVAEAQQRGYLTVKGDRITYHCKRDYSDSLADPEELVRANSYSWLVIRRNYSPKRMNMEVKVPRRTPSDLADIVVYRDDACREPYLIVENKHRQISETERRQAIEQGFGNANSLRAPLMLLDYGRDNTLFDVGNFPQGERELNQIGKRDALPSNYGEIPQFTLIANGSTDIAPVAPEELERRVRRAHGMIWAGGKRDPLQSFDEWSKLLFAKIYDERRTANGEARRFQVGLRETATEVGNRIRQLYAEARHSDRSVFIDEHIELPDDKIREVVSTVQSVGLTLMSVDALGHAFEHFFSSIFRGGLGQYFTRRELVRFMVAVVGVTDRDFIIDPTCGSGGFLLEALLQVWHYIDARFAGQPDADRMRYDFAHEQLFGIEINEILGRVCQTNLLLHKDGHTNIETNRSTLDATFENAQLRTDSSVFTVALGNPPFGDNVKADDADALGTNTLDAFELGRGNRQVQSEILVMERAFQFLRPGGRLAMVVPDGLLNNPGEGSHCPSFRRYLVRTAKLDAIISMPDHAFKKSGAQNKTSLLFATKYTTEEKERFDDAYDSAFTAMLAGIDESVLNLEGLQDLEDGEAAPSREQLTRAAQEARALQSALESIDYNVFLAEAENIGYTPSGTSSASNDLYSLVNDLPDRYDKDTVLGQYFVFKDSPDTYEMIASPICAAVSISSLFAAHPSYRMDPKYHLFEHERLVDPPQGMRRVMLRDVLRRREERVIPRSEPDRYFRVPTLTQNGELREREPGGNNPPSWFGEYFTSGSQWFTIYEGDLIFSQIDLWKGCVTIVTPDFDHAIVSKEFPIYEVNTDLVDSHYLKLVLRSRYFQRAIRAITTGHSNRRRTQTADFEDLTIFVPEEMAVQKRVSSAIRDRELAVTAIRKEYVRVLAEVDRLIVGEIQPNEMIGAAG